MPLWCTDVPFSAAELDLLRTRGFAFVADRLVFEAQPPLDDAALAAIADAIGGEVPDQLAALWRETAGGRLDHDLWRFDGAEPERLSFSELFHDASSDYLTLSGWIAEQRELTQEECDERACRGTRSRPMPGSRTPRLPPPRAHRPTTWPTRWSGCAGGSGPLPGRGGPGAARRATPRVRHREEAAPLVRSLSGAAPSARRGGPRAYA